MRRRRKTGVSIIYHFILKLELLYSVQLQQLNFTSLIRTFNFIGVLYLHENIPEHSLLTSTLFLAGLHCRIDCIVGLKFVTKIFLRVILNCEDMMQ